MDWNLLKYKRAFIISLGICLGSFLVYSVVSNPNYLMKYAFLGIFESLSFAVGCCSFGIFATIWLINRHEGKQHGQPK